MNITRPKPELNSPIPVHLSSLIPKMSVFTLAISCLATSNLPWFMDLTFQVPIQYCSLQHQTIGSCYCFGSASSFFLELFLHSLVAYWAPTDVASSSFSVISFCLFILFMGFSRQEYWSRLPSLLQRTTELVCHKFDYTLTFTTRYIHSWVLIPLWPSFFILSGARINSSKRHNDPKHECT